MLSRSNFGKCCRRLMCLVLLMLSAFAAQADTTEYHNDFDIIFKTLRDEQAQQRRYYGLAYRLTHFGFVSFDVATYATTEDVELTQEQLATPDVLLSLKGYYGLRSSMIFAMARLNLQLSILWGQGFGYKREQAGDTVGICDCDFALKEAAVALTFNLTRQWDAGVEKSKLKFSNDSLPGNWSGQSFFLRYSW